MSIKVRNTTFSAVELMNEWISAGLKSTTIKTDKTAEPKATKMSEWHKRKWGNSKTASPSSQGAQDSMMPSLADLRMDSGRGMECLTMAPYSPYSAITVLRPQHFSLFLHLALRFWNHTWDGRRRLAVRVNQVFVAQSPYGIATYAKE